MNLLHFPCISISPVYTVSHPCPYLGISGGPGSSWNSEPFKYLVRQMELNEPINDSGIYITPPASLTWLGLVGFGLSGQQSALYSILAANPVRLYLTRDHWGRKGMQSRISITNQLDQNWFLLSAVVWFLCIDMLSNVVLILWWLVLVLCCHVGSCLMLPASACPARARARSPMNGCRVPCLTGSADGPSVTGDWQPGWHWPTVSCIGRSSWSGSSPSAPHGQPGSFSM